MKWVKRMLYALKIELYVRTHGGYKTAINHNKYIVMIREYRVFLAENF
jgi:hypothetical protein